MHKRQRSSDLSQEKSRMTHLFTQAYQQAPWRLQLQRIGGFLAVLVAVVLVAGFISSSCAIGYGGLKFKVLNDSVKHLIGRLPTTGLYWQKYPQPAR
jgi:hypothetical protein